MSTIGAQASLVNDLRTAHTPRTLTEITNTHIFKLTHITNVVLHHCSSVCTYQKQFHQVTSDEWNRLNFLSFERTSNVPISGPKHVGRYNEAEPENVPIFAQYLSSCAQHTEHMYSTENISKMK